jgi:hypothetical protein
LKREKSVVLKPEVIFTGNSTKRYFYFALHKDLFAWLEKQVYLEIAISAVSRDSDPLAPKGESLAWQSPGE